MTLKMKEAIKKLEESPFADIHTKTAQSLYVRGVVAINGFSKRKKAHLNCSLKQLVLFQEGVPVSPVRGAGAPSCFRVPTFEETVDFFEGPKSVSRGI